MPIKRFFKQDSWGPPPYTSSVIAPPAPTSQGGAISPITGGIPLPGTMIRVNYTAELSGPSSVSAFFGYIFTPPANKQWLVEWVTLYEDYDMPVFVLPPNIGDPNDFLAADSDNGDQYFAFLLGDPARQPGSPPPSYSNLDPPIAVSQGSTLLISTGPSGAHLHNVTIRVQEF